MDSIPTHRTPRHRLANNDIWSIHSRLAACGLAIDASIAPSSPSARLRSPGNAVSSRIRRLYFCSEDKTHEIVDTLISDLYAGRIDPNRANDILQTRLQDEIDRKMSQQPLRQRDDRMVSASRGEQSKDATLVPHLESSNSFEDLSTLCSSTTSLSSTPPQPIEPAMPRTANTSFGSMANGLTLEGQVPNNGCFQIPYPSSSIEYATDLLLEYLDTDAYQTRPSLPKWIEYDADALTGQDFPARWASLLSTHGRQWTAPKTTQDQESLQGRLVFTPDDPAVFVFAPLESLTSRPSMETERRMPRLIKALDGGSCRHRFLTMVLRIREDDWKTRKVGIHRTSVKTYLHEYAREKRDLLGRTYQLFHIEHEGVETKLKKTDALDKRKIKERTLVFTLRYFAVDGLGTGNSLQIFHIWKWVMVFEQNLHSPFCKTWSRMHLSLSQTVTGHVFKPSEVLLPRGGRFDILADGTLESTEFNDRHLDFPAYQWNKNEVMNDGCSVISVEAARRLCQRLNLAKPWPTTFQGRINGAKGLWTIANSYQSSCKDVWIKINSSQLKLRPDNKDLSDRTCATDKWSFELVAHINVLCSSLLYLDFLPILQARGVPSSSIIDEVMKNFSLELSDVLDRLAASHDGNVSFRRWLSSKFRSKELKNRELGLPYSAGSSEEDLETAIEMLDALLLLSKCRALGFNALKLIELWLTDMLKKLKIESKQTTMAFGIADPARLLKPGEICLNFSTPFDDDSGDGLTHLEGDVLVARHPALSESDIQRCRAVYVPELSHIKDTIIFSSKGRVPLASLLQGGDYDGDQFWLCWIPALVKDFWNAPKPTSAPDLAFYGISQDKSTVKDVLNSGNNVDEQEIKITEKIITLALKEDMLGAITDKHKNLAYSLGNLSDSRLQHLVIIHGLIIDSEKNGYIFTEADFRRCMIMLGIPNLPKPAYIQALSNPFESLDRVSRTDHILDILVFDHVLPAAHRFIQEVKRALQLEHTEEEDPDILWPLKLFENKAQRSELASANMKHLQGRVKEVASRLGDQRQCFMNLNKESAEYKKAKHNAHAEFLAIQPILLDPSEPAAQTEQAGNIGLKRRSSLDTDMIESWTKPLTPKGFSEWDLVRAAVLYKLRVKTAWKISPAATPRSALAFQLALRELCFIKANAKGPARAVALDPYCSLLPRKERKTGNYGKNTRRARESSVEED